MEVDCPKFKAWARKNQLDLKAFAIEQRVIINAALCFLMFVKGQRLLTRFLVFFLAHCGTRLKAREIGLICGRSTRAVESTKTVLVKEFVRAAHRDGGRHDKPTLKPVHAGPVARLLFEHPRSTLLEITAFSQERLGIKVGIDGVRSFLRRHGLLDLHKKEPAAPLFSGLQTTAVPGSFFPPSVTCFDPFNRLLARGPSPPSVACSRPSSWPPAV